jgi:hypothetical protein
MSVEEVRQRAERFLSKSRRDRAAFFVFGAMVIVFCAIAAFAARLTSIRIIAALVAVMMLVRVVSTLYVNRVTADAALTTCLQFYRNELERQRELARQPAWQLAVTFLIIGWLSREAWIRTSPEILRVAVPFILFAAAGLIVLLAVRKLQSRRIESELDALNRFEEKNNDRFNG